MKRQGPFAVCSAVAIQLTLGIAYIWSVFQTGIAESVFKGDNVSAALTFSFLLAMLSIGGIIGGQLAARTSTRLVIVVGGILISAGFFLASFVTAEFPKLLWLTYGITGGMGMGFTYSTTIACAQKWYPHKKGLVTGIIVASLGLGGVVFTPVAESLIAFFGGTGVGELKTFRTFSVVFLAVCTLGSLFLKNPPQSSTAVATTPDNSATPKEMLKTPHFYLLTVAFLLACMGGFMMMGFAKPIAVAKGLGATATVGVLAITLFNAIGRLIGGMLSDRYGRINTILMLLSGTAILSLLVNAASGHWVLVLIALIGFFFGGCLSTFPSLTADLFGAKHMATNYGIVLLGFGASAILASAIAGHYRDIARAADDIALMFPAFIIASCCAALGIALMLTLKTIGENRPKEYRRGAE